MPASDGLIAAAEAADSALVTEQGTEVPVVQPEASAATTSVAPKPKPISKETLIQELKGRVERGEIKATDVDFVAPKLQSAVGRTTARLSMFDKAAESVVKTLEAASGVKIPEGKTGFDLFTEDGGRAVQEMIDAAVTKGLSPVTEKMSKEDEDNALKASMAEAANVFPEVKKHYMDTLGVIDTNPQLLAMARKPGQLGWIMAGVAADLERQAVSIERDALKTEVEKLREIVKTGKFATSVGGATTRAGATPPAATASPRGLRAIAEAKYDELVGGAN